MRKWMIWLAVIIILVAAGGGAYYYYYAPDKTEGSKQAAAITARVTRGNVVNQISGTGSVVANSRETVTAGKSGTIAAVNFKEGDTVKKGQVIATFEESDDYKDQIKSITRSIEKLQDQIADDQEKYKEATGTENEEETKQSIQKDMDQANEDIADNQEDLQDIYDKQNEEVKEIVAPIDGQVTDLAISAGDEVQSNTTVADIVDYNYLEFVTSVDELDIPKVSLGQTANISLSSFTDKTFEGTVSDIAKEGTASNGSSSFEVSILLKDIDGVMVGMSGEANITIDSREDVLLVPVDAVVSVGGKKYVRVQSASAASNDQGAAETKQQGGGTAGGAAGSGETKQQGGDQASGQAQGTSWQGGRGQGQSGGSSANTTAAGSGGFSGKGAAGGNRTVANEKAAGDSSAAAGAPQNGAAPNATQGSASDDAKASGTAPDGQGAGTAAGGSSNERMKALLDRIDTLGGTLVEVTTGLSNDTYVEITSGLEEGQVVLMPAPSGEKGMGETSTKVQQAFPGGFSGSFGGGGFSGGGFSGGGGFSRSGGGGGGAR